MPGPVSDSYDPEWGTSSNREEIYCALGEAHQCLTEILSNRPPIYVVTLVNANLPRVISADLTERQWRLLRFAVERARESL